MSCQTTCTVTYTVSQLAADCGVSETDAAAFVECLRVWLDKGMTFEQAVERHMRQMLRLAEHSADLSRDEEVRAAVVGLFYPSTEEG